MRDEGHHHCLSSFKYKVLKFDAFVALVIQGLKEAGFILPVLLVARSAYLPYFLLTHTISLPSA